MQIKLLSLVLGLLVSQQVSAADLIDPETPQQKIPDGWRLVFSDEFNSPRLDSRKWRNGTNRHGIQNSDLDAKYCESNVSLRNGNLVLLARKEKGPLSGKTYGGEKAFDYSSAAVNTSGLFTLKNNMFVEIRVKFPSNPGGFCAFWSMPEGHPSASVEDLVEIDFFEYIADKNRRKFWSTLWWHDFRKDEISEYISMDQTLFRTEDHYFVTDQKHKAHTDTVLSMNNHYYTDYVVHGFMVTDEAMEWHFVNKGPVWDERPYMSFEGGRVHSLAYDEGTASDDSWERSVASLNHRLIIEYALREAEWAGGPVKDAALPAEMLIDYIRVYEF